LRSSKGIIQGIGLLGLSVAGALLLQPHSAVSSATASTNKSGTATGDSVDYQYGTVQVKVTETNGTISAIDLVQAGATGGREQAFSYLVKDAISANGASFGNLSGATYTTDAFKQALNSAISKLG
jgi:uncharacterized protein with FMN-binding domain